MISVHWYEQRIRLPFGGTGNNRDACGFKHLNSILEPRSLFLVFLLRPLGPVGPPLSRPDALFKPRQRSSSQVFHSFTFQIFDAEMSFLSLSLEIRENIYRELLCPPSGIHLHTPAQIKFKQDERNRAEIDTAKPALSKEEEDENEDEQEGKCREVIATVPIPVSILSANRQISREATRILFRYNRFTCHLTVRRALDFLRDLDPHTREVIKDIGFGQSSFFFVEDGNFFGHWRTLPKFIGEQMHVDTVTIAVPPSRSHEVIGKHEWDFESFYWWPALEALGGLLLEGRIRELRLGYAETYGKLKDHTVKDGEDEFCAVWRLRYRYQGRSFSVRREDALTSDVGTVLILTVPNVGRRSDYSDSKNPGRSRTGKSEKSPPPRGLRSTCTPM